MFWSQMAPYFEPESKAELDKAIDEEGQRVIRLIEQTEKDFISSRNKHATERNGLLCQGQLSQVSQERRETPDNNEKTGTSIQGRTPDLVPSGRQGR